MTLEEMLIQYRDTKRELEPALAELAKQESAIKKHVLETGELAKVDGASISIRNGYDRTSWDGKGLVGYAVAYPEVNQFKKVTAINPSAVIKVEK